MDISGATIMILGGSGLVGHAVARRLLACGPRLSQAAERRSALRGSGSDEEWFAIEPSEPIVPWRMATWIFRHEDKGERIKR
jgi:uncharacterized protein YbjT (DUF2867 family)